MIWLRTLFIALLVGVVVYTGPTLAQTAGNQDTLALEETVHRFIAAVEDGDYFSVTQRMPPKLITLMAERNGMSESQLISSVTMIMISAMKETSFRSFEMTAEGAAYRETTSGRGYALVPTRFIMKTEDAGALEVNTYTLALMDDGTWYLVRVDAANLILMLTEAYPDFKDVEFPQHSIRAID